MGDRPCKAGQCGTRASGTPFGSAATAILLVVACAVGPRGAAAQTASGSLAIELRTGSIAGEVCLTPLQVDSRRARRRPPRADTIHILPNAALALEAVDGNPPTILRREPEPGGATVLYHLERSSGSPSPPCFTYGGTLPVYDVGSGVYREDDASSLIAFNGKNVRARGAARWLPTPFDPVIGLPVEALALDLRIACSDCAAIYLNGAEPQAGPTASFRSREPREPLLLAGNLPIYASSSGRVIGERPRPEDADALFTSLGYLADFYSAFTGVPFGPLPEIVRVDPLRRNRRGQLWGFFSDPALALIGSDVEFFARVLGDPRDRRHPPVFAFVAHELAHRYFGWRFGLRSPQRDLFGEPIATYLELKAVRHFRGPEAYERALGSLRENAIRSSPETPLHSSGPLDYRQDDYRYAFAPAVLLSLEQAIGEDAMRRTLRELILAPASERETASFDWLLAVAFRAGAPPGAIDAWKTRCTDVDTFWASCFRSDQ